MDKKHVLYLFATGAAVVALTFGLTAFADSYSAPDGVPRLVPFRGYLEQSGSAVSSPVTVSFSLYDAATGGTRVWGPEAHTVMPAAGEFSVMLGTTQPLAPALTADGDLWIEVQTAGVTLSGRQRLASAPYAIRAARAREAETAQDFRVARQLTIGVATPDPAYSLESGAAHVAGDLQVDGRVTVNGGISDGTTVLEPFNCALVSCNGTSTSYPCACPAGQVVVGSTGTISSSIGYWVNRINCCQLRIPR